MQIPHWLRTCSLLLLFLAVGRTVAQAQAPGQLILTVDFTSPSGEIGLTSIESLNTRGTRGINFREVGHAFLLTNTGGLTEIRCRGAAIVQTTIAAINNHDEAAGTCRTESPTEYSVFGFLRFTSGRFQILRFPGASITAVADMNDHREAVGTFATHPFGSGGWFWRGGGNFEVLSFRPTALTNQRQILGYRNDETTGLMHGVLRGRDGTLHALDYPGARNTIPLDRNASGATVGVFEDSTGFHAFLLDKHGWRPFTLPQPGFEFFYPHAINDKGQIAGDVAVPWQHPTNPDTTSYFVGFVASAVPPPPPAMGMAMQQRQEEDANEEEDEVASASFGMMASAALVPEVTPNKLTLQRSDVPCRKASAVSAKVQGWQICERE